jgi:hypothetical protein
MFDMCCRGPQQDQAVDVDEMYDGPPTGTGMDALREAEKSRLSEEEAEEKKELERLQKLAEAGEPEQAKDPEPAEDDPQTRERKRQEYLSLVEEARAQMHRTSEQLVNTHVVANRYGTPGASRLPHFDENHHVPTLALLNDRSGAKAGFDILNLTRELPYYKDNFFNIVDVVKSGKRGGLLDVFREQLNKAKEKAKAMGNGVRPRLISGGGDGTASFALHVVFRSLRPNPDRKDDGLEDTGNGFIWSDEEMRDYFPALAQMPLGSANDLGNILGWGRKFPGHGGCCTARTSRLKQLQDWVDSVIDPKTLVTNFDVWGIMPDKDEDQCNFKLAQLTGKRGISPKAKGADGKLHVLMEEADTPVPFFICLYFSAGFMAYVAARFQINRHDTHLKNDLEYVRQGAAIVLGSTPPELSIKCDGMKVSCDDEAYFPPRSASGKAYRDVGFYNINWQAHLLHGADRSSLPNRLCGTREPVKFNDGQIDVWRFRLRTLLKNPGVKIQVDKKKDFRLTYDGGKGKGIFFQWDGESRFAFSPSGKDFSIYIRKVLNIPVVMGPKRSVKLTGDLDNGSPVTFGFSGDTQADRDAVRARVVKSLGRELNSELNATKDEIKDASMMFAPDYWDEQEARNSTGSS